MVLSVFVCFLFFIVCELIIVIGIDVVSFGCVMCELVIMIGWFFLLLLFVVDLVFWVKVEVDVNVMLIVMVVVFVFRKVM